MAKRKIIWSHRAKISRYKILKFYIERNKSNLYSRKLNKRIKEELRLLQKFPKPGIKTDIEGVRGLIIDSFIIFYEIDKNLIIAHYIWDSRQDPKNLRMK